ncbi:MAG: ATP-grasp domain-containing protein [Polyangiaceae bacterium]
MRIALTFSARGPSPADDDTTDTTATVEMFASAFAKLGHEVDRIDVTGSPARVIARLEAMAPDLIVNLAEAARSRPRDALFPAIFEELGIPCVGDDTWTLCLFAEKLAKGASLEDTLRSLIKASCKRFNIAEKPDAPRRPKKALRVGLVFNMKREAGDDEAEFDSPRTIQAIHQAIESFGHTVVPLEADADLPMSLAGAHPDIVFNVAEGRRGRGREAQVPALCEMLGIPYTASDPTTLAICLDKSLAKQILRAAEIDTAAWQLLTTGREKLRPMRYPVIVKPNAEGTSKGITGASVVHDEAGIRAAARDLIDRYGQPALVEEYIRGREFTVGVLGDRRPRVLPIMEVIFVNMPDLPVYGFEEKQSDTPRVRFECPAKLTPTEQRRIEKTVRDTFAALDCRDVARVDMRMAEDGRVYVIEVNPLPGLAPNFSDLCNIALHAGMDHKALIGEIMAGAIKRYQQGKTAMAPTIPPAPLLPKG